MISNQEIEKFNYYRNLIIPFTDFQERFDIDFLWAKLIFYYYDADNLHSDSQMLTKGVSSQKIMRALPLFESINDTYLSAIDFSTDKSMNMKILQARVYFQLCSFYKKFVIQSLMLEDSNLTDFLELLEVLVDLEQLNLEKKVLEELQFSEIVIFLLFHQRSIIEQQINNEQVVELVENLLSYHKQNIQKITLGDENIVYRKGLLTQQMEQIEAILEEE